MSASETNGRPPFRAEHIGSLLRPGELKAAHRARAEGKIDDAELAAITDRCIVDAIRLQEQAGLEAITDGEFRRGSWFLGFVQAVEGLSTKPALFNFQGEHGAWQCPHAHGKVRRTGGITVGEFEFVRAHTAHTPKITMPTPSAMLFYRGAEAADRKVYPRIEALYEDLVEVYRAELRDLAAAGCTYVQLDEVPLARKVSMRSSAGLMTTSATSSASGSTATVHAEVWMRPCASVSGTRCTRWPPDSNFSFE